VVSKILPFKRAGGLPFSIDTLALYFQQFVWKGGSFDDRLHRHLPDLPKRGDAGSAVARCSPFSMLINNSQHPPSFFLQAHLALETHRPFRVCASTKAQNRAISSSESTKPLRVTLMTAGPLRHTIRSSKHCHIQFSANRETLCFWKCFSSCGFPDWSKYDGNRSGSSVVAVVL
jgi:hypothetical protein